MGAGSRERSSKGCEFEHRRGGNARPPHGTNACGKTSLALTIMGYPSYGVVKGSITFEGQEITSKPIHERAKLGIALAHQSPPEVRGVKLRDLIRVIVGEAPWNPLLEVEESGRENTWSGSAWTLHSCREI